MDAYRSWIVEQALPTWAERGFDRPAGRFVERLDWAGRPMPVPHRAMVQARQIYVFSHAAALGWFPQGAALADAAARSLGRDFVQSSAGKSSITFSIDPATGKVLAETRDAYTHAFVLFALAHLYAVTGDKAAISLARQITLFIEDELTDAVYGGLHDALPTTGAKRQNPHMHLLEAYLALAAVTPGEGYEARADHLVSLFHEKFAHHEHGVLLEHFSEDWSAHPMPEMASIFEPGHHFEWIWLLRRHETLLGSDHSEWRRRLQGSAMEHGFAADGRILDEVGVNKHPVKASSRLWPHTEAIKAAAVWHGEGDASALGFARNMADTLLAHFLDKPFPGGWADHLSPDFVPLVDYVPASSLYHLVLAAAEAESVFGTTSEHAPRVLAHA